VVSSYLGEVIHDASAMNNAEEAPAFCLGARSVPTFGACWLLECRWAAARWNG